MNSIYGWGMDDDLNQSPEQIAGAGAIGSQPGSQTDGQGAGITPPPTWEAPPVDPSQGAGASGPTDGAWQGSYEPPPTGTATPAQPKADPSQTIATYTDLLNKIRTATDPQQAALQKDQLSRQLYSTLADQGHDVKWDGDNLMVDGRAYVVAGGGSGFLSTTPPGTIQGGGGAVAPPPGDADFQRTWANNVAQGKAPQAGMWAPNNQGFLDWAMKTYGQDPDPNAPPGFVKLPQGQQLKDVLARYAAETGNRADYLGGPSGDRVDFGHGAEDALTSSGQIWNAAGGGGGGAPSGPGGYGVSDGPMVPWGSAPGPAPTWGVPTWQQQAKYEAPTAPTMTSQYDDMLKRAMARDGTVDVEALKAAAGNPMLTGDLANWRPQGGGYVPGEIGSEDIPDFTYESLLADMGKGQEGSNALLDRIIANPESLDKQTTDTMKGQMKDVLAEQQKQEEEDLRGFGAASGISDSGWLASQRAGSRRGRDMAVAKGAQDVDIQAATTNAEDRRKAAGLGLQRGEQRRAQVQAASDAALSRSAAIGNRLQLRESVKQEAAKLRISEDQVMSNFVQSKQDALLKKYGIDLGAGVDVARLNEQSAEFKESLMEKMASLEKTLSMQKYGIDTTAAGNKYQAELASETSRYGTDVGAMSSKYGADLAAATSRYGTDVNARLTDAQREQLDRQFAAGLGLDYDKFNFLRDQDQWKRMQDLYGGA